MVISRLSYSSLEYLFKNYKIKLLVFHLKTHFFLSFLGNGYNQEIIIDETTPLGQDNQPNEKSESPEQNNSPAVV